MLFMKNTFLVLLFFNAFTITAQKNTEDNVAAKPGVINVMVKTDSSVVTKNQVTIKGKLVPYTATAGTIPLWDEDGKAIAGIFYTYYERSDVKDESSRPLVISFNGGPGTPSVWMEIGYTGPRILNIDDEGYPVQPYGLHDNPSSILDIADIVYVDPVNTGFSRLVSKDIPGTKFFGVNEDIKYLAEWLNTFVTRKKTVGISQIPDRRKLWNNKGFRPVA